MDWFSIEIQTVRWELSRGYMFIVCTLISYVLFEDTWFLSPVFKYFLLSAVLLQFEKMSSDFYIQGRVQFCFICFLIIRMALWPCSIQILDEALGVSDDFWHPKERRKKTTYWECVYQLKYDDSQIYLS